MLEESILFWQRMMGGKYGNDIIKAFTKTLCL